MGGLYAGSGAGIGQAFAPSKPVDNTPPGFNTPMAPLNRNYGQLLGSNQANVPSFQNYSPYQMVMQPNSGYSFFPVQR